MNQALRKKVASKPSLDERLENSIFPIELFTLYIYSYCCRFRLSINCDEEKSFSNKFSERLKSENIYINNSLVTYIDWVCFGWEREGVGWENRENPDISLRAN